MIGSGPMVTPRGVGDWNITVVSEKIVLVDDAGAQASPTPYQRPNFVPGGAVRRIDQAGRDNLASGAIEME